jgi:outer membrane cobalamin receptor
MKFILELLINQLRGFSGIVLSRNPLRKSFFFAVTVLFASSHFVQAQTKPDSSSQKIRMLDTMTVTTQKLNEARLDRLGAMSNAIQPTSVVTPEAIFLKNADDFTQAVTSEPGVCVLTGCSSCGFKQIQINGLGANHTTVLVDGLPIYTPVTSFYGVDALTTAGVADIDISRGPGASLLAPGAMGGAMDVRFRNPTRNAITADAAIGNNDWNHLSFSGTAVLDSAKLGILVAGHHFYEGQWDADGNGVSESPSLNDESALLRLNGLIGENWSWNLRYMHGYSEVFGAAVTSNHMGAAIGPADSIPLYADGDVRKAFVGNPQDIIEWVQTTRDEAAGALTWDSPHLGTWQLRTGIASQSQVSEYEGGADYNNSDNNVVGDLRWMGTAWANTLTLGVDANIERMASQSHYYYQVLGITPDSYNATFGGGYAQDVWNFGHERDLSLALRLDDIDVNWINKPGQKINNFIAAPRASLRWEFIEGLTGRVSAGLGWRAPLTFFELDHGLLDNGFDIGVTKLEKAEGAGGSLSFDRSQWEITAGAYVTQVSDLEFVDNNPALPRPVLRNDSIQLTFLDVDAEASFIPWNWLKLGIGIEHQQIPDQYKAVELVAAMETEINGRVEMNYGPASLSGDVAWTAPRDLTPYGYTGQYNVFENGVASDPKLTQAPGYAVVNLKATWKLLPVLDLYAGAENLLNYTQTGSAGDDPHFWDDQGNFNTSHIWGPLRGRQMYVGLRLKT